MQIAVVGLGLIGGSIAKSLKKNIEDLKITAYDVNEVIKHIKHIILEKYM